MPVSLANAAPAGGAGGDVPPMEGGRKRRGVSVKTLKRALKKAGLKTTGKKAALTRRAKKARLMRGGVSCEEDPNDPNCTTGGRRRGSRKGSRKGLFGKLF